MARKGGKDRGIFFKPRPNGEVVGPNGRRGEWWARWYDADGKEHREKGGPKGLALDLFRRRKTEVRQGHIFPEKMRQRDVRLKDLVDDYLDSLKYPTKRRPGAARTADLVKRRLVEVLAILGNPAAKTIQAEDLERLKIKLTTGTLTATRRPASVNRYLQDLKAVFRRAVKAGRLERDPFLKVDLLPEHNKRTRELTPEEEFRLFQTLPAEPPVLRPYFRFLLETGARAGEACALTWRAILWADGAAELPETKAGRKQYLTLSRAALAILEGLLRNGPHVFCWPDGRPLAVDYASHALHAAAERAGIPDLRQHDLRAHLRHSAAAWGGEPGGRVGPPAARLHSDERAVLARHPGGSAGGDRGRPTSFDRHHNRHQRRCPPTTH